MLLHNGFIPFGSESKKKILSCPRGSTAPKDDTKCEQQINFPSHRVRYTGGHGPVENLNLLSRVEPADIISITWTEIAFKNQLDGNLVGGELNTRFFLTMMQSLINSRKAKPFATTRNRNVIRILINYLILSYFVTHLSSYQRSLICRNLFLPLWMTSQRILETCN